MFSVACLILAAAILGWIIRYRVHIHIEYQPRYTAKRRARRRHMPTETPAGNFDAETVATLTEALVSLGATKTAARAAARKALVEMPNGTSDELLRAAIQQATAKGLS
jgi:Holliday junction resolvasome RuvABC DNA-binding subunit